MAKQTHQETAEHHEKGDHEAAHEHSTKAHEHSAKAHKTSADAHGKSDTQAKAAKSKAAPAAKH